MHDEQGCGNGTAAAGGRCDVTVSDYRTWEATVGREEQCKKNQLALAKRFGYEKRFLDYPYHQFPVDNEAKRKLAEIYVEVQPDITFVHNPEDHWPDHANSGIAAKDARSRTSFSMRSAT